MRGKCVRGRRMEGLRRVAANFFEAVFFYIALHQLYKFDGESRKFLNLLYMGAMKPAKIDE